MPSYQAMYPDRTSFIVKPALKYAEIARTGQQTLEMMRRTHNNKMVLEKLLMLIDLVNAMRNGGKNEKDHQKEKKRGNTSDKNVCADHRT